MTSSRPSRRAFISWRALLVLAVPFVFFIIPLAAGFDWLPIGPQIPEVPDVGSYSGRRPDLPVTIEYYGSGAVIVPFRAHVRRFLQTGELPLWNPDAALGQPLAAQGEGGPYSPLAILRALLPPTWATSVTIGAVFLSAVALFLFLRQLGISEASSALGGAAWALSGALALQIGRDNLADQLSLIPLLFLAAAWAIRTRRLLASTTFAVVACLHTLAGFLQIGLNTLLLMAGFIVVFSYLQPTTPSVRARTVLSTFLFLGLGLALASPYTLPIAEALSTAYHKNNPYLAFIPIPSANVIAFFFPLLFGPMLHGWLEGSYPDVADWNNLFAYAGTTLLLLTVVGLAALGRQARCQRILFLFFVGAGIFFLGRYVSLPPVAAIDVLPILNQQSPKHTNGVTVFCFVVAASFASGWLRQVDWWRAALYLGVLGVTLASSVLTLVGRRGGADSVDGPAALMYLGVTLAIVVVVLGGLWWSSRAASDPDAALMVAGIVIAELSVYLPLGNGDFSVLAVRLAVFAVLVLAGILLAGGNRMLAALCGAISLGVYAGVVMLPPTGLPNRFDVERVPSYLTWLRDHAGEEYRAFGIQPDYGSLAGVQDIEAVGPLATPEFIRFVGLISSPDMAAFVRNGSTFSLVHPVFSTPHYDIASAYPVVRPIFDWMGVRYLVFSRRVYDTAPDGELQRLLEATPELTIIYADDQATIVEAPSAQAKAIFAFAAQPINAPDDAIQQFAAQPAAIDGPVLVEATSDALGRIPTTSSRSPIAIPLASYRPNDLRASLNESAPGVLVVKDSYFPGWQATLDGQPADIVRVNGMVRGIVVPTRGRHEITMHYRPPSFSLGLILAALAFIVVVGIAFADTIRRRAGTGQRAMIAAPPRGASRQPT